MFKIRSPIPHRKSRIEIIPLIDIMFFLLAAFMMVSLQMTRSENVRVDLPVAQESQVDFQPGGINITVDRQGRVFYEKGQMELEVLAQRLADRFRLDPRVPVTISGDTATEHGQMTRVYRLVRGVGIQTVAFCVAPAEASTRGVPAP